MLKSVKQHLRNIWISVHGNVKQHRRWVEKKPLKKSVYWIIGLPCALLRPSLKNKKNYSRKSSYIFRKDGFSYILGWNFLVLRLKNFLYFLRKKLFLYFERRFCRTCLHIAEYP